jgi:hypothetical protein
MFRVPASSRLIWQPVVPVVTFPETVRVPVVMLTILFRPLDVANIVNEPHVRSPALRFTVQLREVEGLGMLKSPVMESEFVPLKVNALFVVTPAKVSEAH